MSNQKYFPLALAFLGGTLTVLGERLIVLFIGYVFNFLSGTSWSPYSHLPTFQGVLLSFFSGFLALEITGPFAFRKYFSRQGQEAEFPSMGLWYGALSGLLTCLILAFLHISLFFSGPILYARGLTGLEYAANFYTYLRVVFLYIGPLAALFGAISGVTVQITLERYLFKNSGVHTGILR